MAVTQTIPLAWGTATPLDQTGGSYIDRGSLITLTAKVITADIAPYPEAYLYLWWPEINSWTLYAENGMTLTNGYLAGRYQKDLDQGQYFFLLVPAGFSLSGALIKGSRNQ